MVKYYWYINLDPEKHSGFMMVVDNYIKRLISVPPLKYSYITESIDGYNHVVTGKNGLRILSMNDGGNLSGINSIQGSIINALKNKFNADAEAAREDATDKEKRRPRESTSLMFPSDDDDIIISSMRRKKRIKARINRVKVKKPQFKRGK